MRAMKAMAIKTEMTMSTVMAMTTAAEVTEMVMVMITPYPTAQSLQTDIISPLTRLGHLAHILSVTIPTITFISVNE